MLTYKCVRVTQLRDNLCNSEKGGRKDIVWKHKRRKERRIGPVTGGGALILFSLPLLVMLDMFLLAKELATCYM